jgi:hypothetical protein
MILLELGVLALYTHTRPPTPGRRNRRHIHPSGERPGRVFRSSSYCPKGSRKFQLSLPFVPHLLLC